jgi:hypothetical protein
VDCGVQLVRCVTLIRRDGGGDSVGRKPEHNGDVADQEAERGYHAKVDALGDDFCPAVLSEIGDHGQTGEPGNDPDQRPPVQSEEHAERHRDPYLNPDRDRRRLTRRSSDRDIVVSLVRLPVLR